MILPVRKLISILVLATVMSSACDKPQAEDNLLPEMPEIPQEPQDPEDDGLLSILFIGNSFTMDSVTHLPGMIQAAGINNIHMVHMYYGGRLVSQYYKGWETSSDYTRYECRPGESRWTSTKGMNLKAIAGSKEWDVVVIQEHTGNKDAWDWNSAALGNFSGLLQCIRSSQEKEPEFYYILSQAYWDMSKIAKASQPSMTWTDRIGMWNVLSVFGKNAMATFRFDGLISTGAMLENLRTSSYNNSMGLTRDGYHMDNGLARYGASCTVFESIITPRYEITLDKNVYRYDVSDNTSGKITTPVTDASAAVALQAARYAMSAPYGITDMSDF